MKRILTILGILVLLLAIGIGTYFVLLVKGVGGVDDWTVRRVLAIVNSSLEPQFDFERVTLAVGREANDDGALYAIRFEGITLTSSDGTEVIRADAMRVSLAEMPTRGEPVVIQSITLDTPEIRLIRESRDGGSSGFRGLVPFVKPLATQRDVDPEIEGTTTLSEVLALRRISVTNAAVVYEDLTRPDLSAMRLADIGFDLLIHPEPSEDGRTLHGLNLNFGRAPILTVTLEGKADLDALTAQIDALTLNADLEHQDAIAALPPELQSLIAEYEVRGMLSATISGLVDVQNAEHSELLARVTLTDGNIAAGEYRLPIESVTVDAHLSNQIVTAQRLDVRVLGGLMQVQDARAELSAQGRPASAKWSVEGVQLTQALRSGSSETPTMAGVVSSTGQVSLSLDDPLNTSSGSGSVQVRDGRLVQIPVLTNVLAAADLIGRLQGRDTNFKDTADSRFDIQPGGLQLQSLEIVVPVAKFNGTGLIGFNGAIDLRMRGGAVERVPILGDIAGAVTGRLVEYRVTRESGQDIRVRINPLGIGN